MITPYEPFFHAEKRRMDAEELFLQGSQAEKSWKGNRCIICGCPLAGPGFCSKSCETEYEERKAYEEEQQG